MMISLTSLSLKDVKDAAAKLRRTDVQITPVCTSETLSNLVNTTVTRHIESECESNIPNVKLYFKCENLQTTGSFKFRGATHFISKLSNEELTRGIIAYSTGRDTQSGTQQHKNSSN